MVLAPRDTKPRVSPVAGRERGLQPERACNRKGGAELASTHKSTDKKSGGSRANTGQDGTTTDRKGNEGGKSGKSGSKKG